MRKCEVGNRYRVCVSSIDYYVSFGSLISPKLLPHKSQCSGAQVIFDLSNTFPTVLVAFQLKNEL